MDFLKAITAREARSIIEAFPTTPGTCTVGIEDASGRVLAEDIVSRESIPAFTRSLVDGFAVKTQDVQGARETSPAFLNRAGEVRIGEEARQTLLSGQCISVSTGSMIPAGADAVAMQEYTRPLSDAVEITRAVHLGENICYKGEDIKNGQGVLLKGSRISPFGMGILAALGMTQIPVYQKPKVGLISSGDEIVGIDETPPLGRVRDINRYTTSALLGQAGAQTIFLGHAKDSIAEIAGKLASARDCDIILISGGSSKGERDYITASIDELGGDLCFHGVNIKPGKPTIFARLFGKPLFGLPGHPSSCAMATVRLVLPLVRRLQGETEWNPCLLKGVLTTNVPSSYGIEEYVRISLKKDGEDYGVTPIFSKSAVISSLDQADGYVIVPEGTEGLEKGEIVEVYTFGR